MAGIKTGMSNMAKQMPGMLNALGQNYGGSLSGAARGSAGLLGMRKPGMPQMGKVTSGIPAGQMPGTPVAPPSIPELSELSQINTMPSQQLFERPYANLFGGTAGYGSIPNAGISGGLRNRPPGYQRPTMGAPSSNVGGMFGAYNRFASNPNFGY